MNISCTKFDFNPIAANYDQCNRLFSLGIDRRWRRELVKSLNARPRHHVLDLCCGTGDIVYSFLKHSPVQNIVGADISELMIDLAQEKQIYLNSKSWMHHKEVAWKLTDAAHTGLESGSFDIVTCAFGIRNISDRMETLHEIRRVLKSNGKLGILEFSLPANPLVCFLYNVYLGRIMPWLGKWIVGDKEPLRYLARSIVHWHRNVDFSNELARSGFKLIRKTPLTGGAATLWLAIVN